jgi:hypothetical protein
METPATKPPLGRPIMLHQAYGTSDTDVKERNAPCLYCGKLFSEWKPLEECPGVVAQLSSETHAEGTV